MDDTERTTDTSNSGDYDPEEDTLAPLPVLGSQDTCSEFSDTTPEPQGASSQTPAVSEIPGAANLRHQRIMRLSLEFREPEQPSAGPSNRAAPMALGTAESRQAYLLNQATQRQQPLIHLPYQWSQAAAPSIQWSWRAHPNNQPPREDGPDHFQIRTVDTYPDNVHPQHLSPLDTYIREWWSERFWTGRPVPRELFVVAPRVPLRMTQEEHHPLHAVAAFNFHFRDWFLHHDRNNPDISAEASPYELLVPETTLYPTTRTGEQYSAFTWAELMPDENTGLPEAGLRHATLVRNLPPTWDTVYPEEAQLQLQEDRRRLIETWEEEQQGQ
jgi:hypothetical protein